MTRKSPAKPRRRKPTIEALRALMVLADSDGVSEAARRLGVTQPVVTKKLRVFKDANACGSVLLQSNGRLMLTDSARSVLPAIRELVSRYDRLIGSLQGEETAPRVMRVGVGNFAAEHYIPKAILAVRDMLEDCQVESRICRGRDRVLQTAQGTLDLAVLTHDEQQMRRLLREQGLDASTLQMTRLARHRLCLLASPETAAGRELQRLSPNRSVPVGRLDQWELIGPDRQSGIRRQLEEHAAPARLYFVAEGGGWAAGKQYARAGLGVALVPITGVTAADRSAVSSPSPTR